MVIMKTLLLLVILGFGIGQNKLLGESHQNAFDSQWYSELTVENRIFSVSARKLQSKCPEVPPTNFTRTPCQFTGRGCDFLQRCTRWLWDGFSCKAERVCWFEGSDSKNECWDTCQK